MRKSNEEIVDDLMQRKQQGLEKHPLRRKTLCYAMQDGILFIAHTVDTVPSDEEWAEFVSMGSAAVESGELQGLVVHAPGRAGPTSSQRKLVTDMWRAAGRTVPLAIMHSSKFVKAIVAMLNLFLPRPMKAFKVYESAAAVEYVGLKGDQAINGKHMLYRLAAMASPSSKRRMVWDVGEDIHLY